MVYAALISLVRTIDPILNRDQSYPISLAEYLEIRSIRGYAILLQEYLKVSRKKTISLEGRITEVANEAEDIIECLMLENNRWIDSTLGEFKRQARKVAKEMKSIVGEIKDSFKIKDVPLSEPPAAAAGGGGGSSSGLAPTGTNDMVGFDDDRKRIMDLLFGEQSDLQIIPIFGMGGIGKTTLARNIYDHPTTMNHFHIRAWVTASQYSEKEIFSSLLLSMGVPRENTRGQSNDLMGMRVYKNLFDWRYLIVIDDVWSVKVLDRIKFFSPQNNNGSRIMITTRQSPEYFSFWYKSHQMRLMDDDQSWDLLQHKVFGFEACPDELQDIGKEIARSCGGLPFSIVATAEILSTIDPTRASWEAIADTVVLAATTKDEQFEMMLSLSYTQLPHHLRPCLLYMAGFPKDQEIRVSKLIKLWVAEGFVKPNKAITSERLAEDYLVDLVQRSLVLVTSRKYNGKIRSCGLHDVMRDFCIRKVQEENFLLPVMDYLPSSTLRRYFLPQILKNQRRISLTSYDLDLMGTIYNSPVHTIICIPQRGYPSMGSVKNFRLLQVLHAVNENYVLNWEPDHDFELIHLRYLASNIPLIPAAVSKLQNLQTLIIYRHDISLPVEIWSLTKLRYLIAFSFHPLPHPEVATFPLGNLKTLSLATNFVCSERILKLIPNLEKLGICYSQYKFDQDYHLDNLQHLFRLEKLKLEIRQDFPLGNLNPVFPRWLQKLTLCGCRLRWKEMKIVSSLPNLQVLKLRDIAFQGDKWEPTEGKFLSLEYLLIDGSDLQYWSSEDYHFRMLKCLLLYRCPYLQEIPDRIGGIRTLELIEVDDRNGSLVESAKRIQEEQQENNGNDSLQVRVKHF